MPPPPTSEQRLNQVLEAIVAHVPPPRGDVSAPLQLLVTNLDASDYLGRIGCGRDRHQLALRGATGGAGCGRNCPTPDPPIHRYRRQGACTTLATRLRIRRVAVP